MIQPVAIAFQQSENAKTLVPLAGRDDLAHRRAIERDRVGEPLFATGKTVAGEGALRKDDQLRSRHRRRLEPVQDLLEVRIQPAELRLHLDGGDAVSRGRLQSVIRPVVGIARVESGPRTLTDVQPSLTVTVLSSV